MKLFEGMGAALKEIRNSGNSSGYSPLNSVENVRAFLEVNELSHIIDFIYSGRVSLEKRR
jgi:hypothetical protein